VMWVILVLIALDNLGVRITTLVAGLGISGVAVALAVQNILGDLFAAMSIVLDKRSSSAMPSRSIPSRAPSSTSASSRRVSGASPASRSFSPTSICSRAAFATGSA
jgi:hypothetical protein